MAALLAVGRATRSCALRSLALALTGVAALVTLTLLANLVHRRDRSAHRPGRMTAQRPRSWCWCSRTVLTSWRAACWYTSADRRDHQATAINITVLLAEARGARALPAWRGDGRPGRR